MQSLFHKTAISSYLILSILFEVKTTQAQQTLWTSTSDSIANLSSPRAADLNNDGIKDIVFGGAADGQSSQNGIIAINGSNGQILWRTSARNEVFGSAIFREINGDNVPDVFITGRQAQLLALDGSSGQVIWDFFPYQVNPADSGWYNFYNPQFIPDQNNDGVPDLLVANGGDHSAPVWDTLRPAGKLLIINTLNGSIISEATVPDSAEIYCSPVVLDLQNDGILWILYGTGGETLGGHFYACPLSQLSAGTLAGSIVLASDPDQGFIAPASYCDDSNGMKKVYIQSYGGTIYCIKGSSLSPQWTYTKPNTESSSAIVIGNFTGNTEPDAFAILYKGTVPSFTDFYQVMLDGATGLPVFTDSIGTLHFASANACDFDNNGRDEVLITVSENNNGIFRNKIYVLDFALQQISQPILSVSGVNLASTPLITDLDGDNLLELVNITKRDSLNPSGTKGVNVNALNLGFATPNSGIAWASYMGNNYNGAYNFRPSNCGSGSITNSALILPPSCNGLSDGSISPVVPSFAAPYTFVWSNGSVDTALTGIPAGNYTVRITNAQNCYEDINYNLPEPYTISFGGISPPSCPGGANGIASLNSTGCVCMFNTCTFSWSNGVTTMNNSQLTEGWNYVTINHPGGCVVTDSVLVPDAAPVVDFINIQPITCFGDSNGVISIMGNQNYAPYVVTWNNGQQSDSITNLPAGNYSAIVQDIRGCLDSVEINLTQPDLLVLNAVSQNSLCHSTSAGSISLGILGGTSPYAISMNGLNAGLLIDSLQAGSYNISVTDSFGCMADTSGIVISSPAAISVTYSITPEQSPGSLSGIAIAHVNGGIQPYTFLWSDPNQQSDSTAVYLSTGWYTLLITDANGCTFTDSVFVPILVGLEEQETTATEFYPNPAHDRIFLNAFADHVRVVNVSGQTVMVTTRSKSIDISSLSNGLYFIEAETKGKTFRKPLVKSGR
jgi:hypothetical protein